VPCEGLGNPGCHTLREQDSLIDIVLEVGGHAGGPAVSIRAHKVVLAGYSPYMEGLLAGAFCEASQDSVQLHDMDGAAVSAVVDACYTGSVSLTLATAGGVIRAANALQIGAVEETAVGFITSGLTDETAVQWLIFAAEYAPCGGEHGKALLERCLAHVSKHFAACVQDEAFGRLPAAVLYQVLSDDALDAAEEEVLEALRGWWDGDRVGRQASLSGEYISPNLTILYNIGVDHPLELSLRWQICCPTSGFRCWAWARGWRCTATPCCWECRLQ
jgi:hypothetical protein